MGIRSYLRAATDARQEIARNARLEGELKRLQFANIQLATKLLIAGEQEGAKYRGNEYLTYDLAVEAIDKKYRGVADWGCLQTGNIIDIRAAFIISEGIQVQQVKKEEGEKELEFAEAFLDYNNLDEEMAQEYAKEAEIEGKILLKLDWDEEAKMVAAQYVSWTAKKYKVKPHPKDYTKYLSVAWTPSGADEVKLEPPNFVYKKFGGRVNDPNDAAPKIMKCLTQVDNLDKALRDLREIDRIFAAPVPVMEFPGDPEAAEAAQKKLDEINWKIKKALATSGVFKYVQPAMQGTDMLLKEVESLGEVISGATGVPVHFLGFVHLLANRSTGENLADLLYASTLKERVTWIGAYEETLAKAMAIADRVTGNAQKSTALKPGLLKVTIPFVTQKHWEALEKIFLPAALGGKISGQLFLSRIPGVNVDEELEMQKSESNVKPPTKAEDALKEDDLLDDEVE